MPYFLLIVLFDWPCTLSDLSLKPCKWLERQRVLLENPLFGRVYNLELLVLLLL
ncbi:virulence promoting factor [Winogradskyella sp. D23]|uniref:Virulence promoting factor n=1 Tax=Winogradskyella alexanderae TaxID=2877123 RepID=A0ABS7XNF3_9FLAO|nr:virulence promoting factor [Winogradskyella alexanderae]